MQENRIKVAINPNIVDKHINGDTHYLGNGWKNVELSVQELIAHISDGHPFCAQLLSDKRSSKNYHLTNLIAVDVDAGTTLREALENEFSQNHLTFYYTTANHTVEKNRFRLCFLVDHDITEPDDYRAIKRALGLKYCGDPSTHDPSRISYGNQQARHQLFNRHIPSNVVDELIELGQVERGINPNSDEVATFGITSRRSKQKLKKDLEVRKLDGALIRLADIREHTKIYCPKHNDKNASAFVNLNAQQNTYLRCSTCTTTWWMESDSNKANKTVDEFDFVDAIKHAQADIRNRQNERLIDVKWKDPFNGASQIQFLNQKYLEISALHGGLTLIRSPKGSGKTESLIEVIRNVVRSRDFATLEQLENTDFDEPPRSLRNDYRILLIGHRQALIKQLCNRLELNCYLDDKDYSRQENINRKEQYGVCLDSLWKVQGRVYDLVIIDESEQVLAHLLSETVKNRETVFQLLKHTVSSAKNVVALDADLGWTTYQALTRFRKIETPYDSNKNRVWIIINEYIPSNEVFQMFTSKNDLIGRMKRDIADNKKLFVTCNSKALVDRLQAAIVEEFGNEISKSITSTNSKTAEAQYIILNFQEAYSTHNVILCSPSLGTGLDISFNGDQQIVDCCYGFFETQINTHQDIDQQIRRVRHPKEVRVWVSPQTFSFETEFGVIKHELLANRVIANTFIGFDPVTHSEIYNEEDEFLTLATHIITDQRKSKNQLKKNFIDYKVKTGWQPVYVPKDDELELLGEKTLAIGTKLEQADYVNNIMTAKPIDEWQYERIEDLIEDSAEISRADYWSFLRMKIEVFYQRQVTPDLLEKDERGKLRRAVRLLRDLTDHQSVRDASKSFKEKYSNKTRTPFDRMPDRYARVVLLDELLASTPVFKDHEFQNSDFSAHDLADFSELCKKLSLFVEAQFGFTIGEEIEKSPTKTLNKLLKIVGLSHDRTKTKTADGLKTYFYALDTVNLEEMLELVNVRNTTSNEWELANRTYGFKSQVKSADNRPQFI
ncbi:hypothetical protein B9Z44_11680 [Limnohabitans curvus]|uniref:Replication origin-binding protein domain-containing protein n=1 Tax=Limnohabitans curvus TaxID=323423 RepID=A0A315EQJ9_9BURK|nr:plasmid replication protein, CyRepA1 family [Limnohabitans curvus]PUE60170.1 hypothetical protein B9Z44_11680 [Limnohabitans curvus]